MRAMGFLEEAVSFFQEFQSTLNVDDPNLWKNLHTQSGKAFPTFKFWKTLTPGGISADNMMEMNNEWALCCKLLADVDFRLIAFVFVMVSSMMQIPL